LPRSPKACCAFGCPFSWQIEAARRECGGIRRNENPGNRFLEFIRKRRESGADGMIPERAASLRQRSAQSRKQAASFAAVPKRIESASGDDERRERISPATIGLRQAACEIYGIID
jgi:hypothetical protein